MSYEIIQSITLRKDKVVFRGAPNNVRPLYYETWNVPMSEDTMRSLFKDLCGRSLQPYRSANNGRWFWLMRHPCMDSSGWYLGLKEKPDWVKDDEWVDPEELEKRYKQFRKLLTLSTSKLKQKVKELHPGKYIIQDTETGRYFRKDGRCYRGIIDTWNATHFDYYDACEIEQQYHAKKIKID